MEIQSFDRPLGFYYLPRGSYLYAFSWFWFGSDLLEKEWEEIKHSGATDIRLATKTSQNGVRIWQNN